MFDGSPVLGSSTNHKGFCGAPGRDCPEGSWLTESSRQTPPIDSSRSVNTCTNSCFFSMLALLSLFVFLSCLSSFLRALALSLSLA